MNARKLAIDPLWQCLCPSWTSHAAKPILASARRPALQCAKRPPEVRQISYATKVRNLKALGGNVGDSQQVLNPLYNGPLPERRPRVPRHVREQLNRERGTTRTGKFATPLPYQSIDYRAEETPALYNYMRGAAIDGQYHLCRHIAEMLVRERGEKPNLQLYSTLILANIGADEGAAWRVIDLLAEMEEDGLKPDTGACHAVLKVCAVHVDHLLRTDVLEYMSRRWFQLTEDGAHDVAAGLFREGFLEQALWRLDWMKQQNMRVRPWLLDMAVYTLCEANEVGEALRLMRWRVDSNEPNISRALWMFFLDKASDMRHHPATALAWSSQVNTHYINPASGICLNVLSTAAQAADAEMATEVFDKLSKRGSTFQPIHYELLIKAYLSTDPPDVKRALTILTIMALEKIEPSVIETRSIFNYLHDKPGLVSQAQDDLRELHSQGRKIPIAALNLLIECYVHQDNLPAALNLYKQIHTFVPLAQGAKKTFANIETFNILLKGCRIADPPEERQASFLVSELLALRIVPTPLTFDRLITTFITAAEAKIATAASTEDGDERAKLEAKGVELLDWSFRHFEDMQTMNWVPRYGTLRMLSLALAGRGDLRCWDVLQAGEDHKDEVDGWRDKGKFVRREVEETLSRGGGVDGKQDPTERVDVEESDTDANAVLLGSMRVSDAVAVNQSV